MKNNKRFDYFECFCRMAEFAVQESRLLQSIFSDYNAENLETQYHEMHALEHACDQEKHAMTTALVKEFLPPIERDDLFCLAHVVDDLTDSVESIVAFLYMADIRTLRSDVNEFTALIVECCEAVRELLTEFPHFKKSEKLPRQIIELNDMEERGDRMYAAAMRRLSQDAVNTRELVEWRDMYRSLEKCFDAAESVADNIESAVMKNI